MVSKELYRARREGVGIWDRALIRRAAQDAFPKLDPRLMAKNPVMFVVEVGSVITTVVLLQGLLGITDINIGFGLQVTVWLWFTVLFANFAEAFAEARGKAQADTLRSMRSDTPAKLLQPGGAIRVVNSTELRKGDLVLVEAND